MVGEHGPEPFTTSLPGHVASHADMMHAMSEAVKSVTNNSGQAINLGGVHLYGVKDYGSYKGTEQQMLRAVARKMQEASKQG
jgi:hypothetical protein